MMMPHPAAEEPFLMAGVFGWLHRPRAPAAHGCGVLLCNPFGAAATGTHRNWRLFAVMLAEAGFITLRFDYPGTGDSADGGGANRIAHWIETIQALTAWLTRQEGLREVALCGLRFGALLAAAAAGSTQPLVLLAPPVSARACQRELAVASRTGTAASQGPGLEAAGLSLNDDEIATMQQINYRQRLAPAHRPVLWLSPAWEFKATAPMIASLRANGASIRLGLFENFRNFMAPAYSAQFPETVFARAITWLQGGDHRAIAQRLAHRPEAILPLPGGVQERRHHFGHDGGLFAIETRPVWVDRRRPAVLILNSGAEPHTGHGRMNVLLARRLAAEGLVTLRVDLSGLGDSRRQPLEPDDLAPRAQAQRAWLRAYQPGFVPDALEAVQLLASLGHQHCVLAGLCSGANLALHAALRDARVTGLILINPTFVDRERLGAPSPPPAPRTALRRNLKRALSAIGLTWPLRRRLRERARWLRHEARWALALLCRWDGCLDKPARWLWQLRRRHLSVLAICSEDDDSLRDWWLFAGRVWPHAGSRWRSPVVVKGVSHSFETMAMRDTLIDCISHHLKSGPAAAPKAGPPPYGSIGQAPSTSNSLEFSS